MNVADQDYCIGRGLGAFKAKPGVSDPVFLKHAVEQNIGFLHRRSQGSTFAAVSTSDVQSIPIPKLPILKQRKIAQVLQTIDRAIEHTTALIDKYQQIKAGLMHDLFTRGIGADGKLRPPREQAPELYQQTPIGWIPREWESDTFGNRVSVIDPNPSHRYPGEQEDGVPICSTENFQGDDGFDLSASKMVAREVFEEQQRRCHFSAGDVVFARKGRIGLARRYGDEPKVFSHTVVLFKANSKIVDQPWLLWLSRSHWFLGDIDRRMNSNSGVPTLGVAFINAVAVPFPGPREQKLISQHMDGIAAVEAQERAELRKLKDLKYGLMNDLLTGKIPVTPDADIKEAADV